MVMPEYELYCPICKQKADYGTMPIVTSYSLSRLDLTFFLCSPCRSIGIDRQIFKSQIRAWRNDFFNQNKKRFPPLKWLYQEFWRRLNENVDYYIDRLDYKRREFKKIPR